MTATVDAPSVQITEPGVYDLDPEAYHADPVPGGSLSSTGARKLVAPSCPAKFKHWRDTGGGKPTEAMKRGTAAHARLLGAGQELAVIEHEDWRPKPAQKAVADAEDAGLLPIKRSAYDHLTGMVDAIRSDPLASLLFQPDTGFAERGAIGRDPATGVMLRALIDWLPFMASDTGRLVVPDYKTCKAADTEAITKSMHRFWYPQQAAFYEDVLRLAGYAADVTVVFVFQETEPPYLVHVVAPDPEAMRIARHRNREAIDTYARCTETGIWPGYGDTDKATTIPLPVWVEREYEGII
jgi:hypothetical protein